MKRLILSLVLTAPLALGCGGNSDLNKDLKPIDPNAPRPSSVGGPQPKKGGGDQGPAAKPPAGPQ